MAIKQDLRLLVSGCIGDAGLMETKCFLRNEGSEEIEMSGPTRRVIVIGCPDYNNLGDHAIALAQRKFIQSRLGFAPVMLYGPIERYWKTLRQVVREGDVLCLQGGGNMGTLYEIYENERLAVIDGFRENRIIAFPQTISYGDSAHERRYMEHVKRTYNRHPDLHLVARERMSLERMRGLFPKVDVLLTPDIVLSLPPFEPPTPTERGGLCLCLRADKERRIGSDVASVFARAAGKRFGKVSSTDTMHPGNFLSSEEGETAVHDKIAELAQAQLVVTDRIHGMIFCALSGTPCIALDNSNGKVGQEYEWLKSLPYIRFARSVDEATEMLEAEVPEPGRFPSEEFSPLFDTLAEALFAALG